MADFISTLASQAGIDTNLAEKGVGALLSTLQKHTPGNVYSEVAGAIPNAGGLLSVFDKAAGSSQATDAGGLAGMVGGILGGGKSDALTMLVGQFSKAGFSMDSAKAFLPVVFGFLKNKVSADAMKGVEQNIPGLGDLLGGGEGSSFLGKISKLF
ncbi:MAG: DUF2780 domain-containing protein [Ignavibacteria bacterium]|nr:DUF2780 domain-containing protein [Ignavibacteria bacterium]